jgi:hypothetical protein
LVWVCSVVVVDVLDEEEEEAIGAGSFDFGLTIGDIVLERRSPSHRFFSSSNARRSPCDISLVHDQVDRSYLESTTFFPESLSRF